MASRIWKKIAMNRTHHPRLIRMPVAAASSTRRSLPPSRLELGLPFAGFLASPGPQRLTAGGRMAGGLVAYVRRTVSRAMHAAGSPLRLRTRTAPPAPETGM